METMAAVCTGVMCSLKKWYWMAFFAGVIGMTEAKEAARGVNVNIVKDWSLIAAMIFGVAYVVTVKNDIGSLQAQIALEFSKRDVMIDLAYEMAIKGDRFTASDGNRLENKIDALSARVSAKNARISRIEEHIKDIDTQHEIWKRRSRDDD